MTSQQRKPYNGEKKSVVIGIDVGTTFTGVSYALLETGKIPRIQPVNRFSGQKAKDGNSKVPSVVCYEPNGKVFAVGPDTDPEMNPALLETEGIRRAEWFKLRLRPPALAADKKAQLEKIWSPPEPAEQIDGFFDSEIDDEGLDDNTVILDLAGEDVDEPKVIDKLPRFVTDDFKTPVQVFADFLRYVFESAKEYIIETEGNLDQTFTWSSIGGNIYFVLTHPNGWEGKQQSMMREAAVIAGLVENAESSERITFVTEGEASLHFCLEKRPDLHKKDGGLLVVDCGGGTIDINAYSRTDKGSFDEIASSECLLQGSIFITNRARDYFKGRFKGSNFESDDAAEAMARVFDKPQGAKCQFSKPADPYYVKFGGFSDNDRSFGITNGRFKVDGTQVAKFFEPAVNDIIEGIKGQCDKAKVKNSAIKSVLLVGGFGRSDYLFAQLKQHFQSGDIDIFRPDHTSLNKAVADGAVSWYLDRLVSSRVAKFTYGVKTRHLFDKADPEHSVRESAKVTQANGKSYIPGIFSTILKKESKVTKETQFSQPHRFILTRGQFAKWTKVDIPLQCYRGEEVDPPKWVDVEPNSFQDACTISADMTDIKKNMKLYKNGNNYFYRLDLKVVVQFGFTELKSYVTWTEDGEEKRTNASIFYD